ncbi:hypothetical protein [Magnetospirillum aberrantis]|uniref:Uncharacterized protein n=1 Tax=Magnetospirillum aberrantis SpK TaxID=908842 RepID=A0A7C9UZ44_9PROT|nr:hypothetical protein [Magnetospirillum aberrantis]NFV80054.1 hypothetical protein [Magnetospirillum aberrantis SpK]
MVLGTAGAGGGMMAYRTYVDCFSVGLDELPRKVQRDGGAIIEILRKTKRFSVFEATANETIAKTMDAIGGRLTTDPNSQYPWIDIIAIDGIPLEDVGHA